MGIITTQILGFGQPKPSAKQQADPKPVRGFNYAGQPMADGEYYNGRPEHMAPEKVEEPKPLFGGPARYKYARAKRRTPEAREKQSAKMVAWWAKKRAKETKAEPESTD